MLDLKLPGICDVSVTNVCNAACDFCGFARDKALIGSAKYLDADAFARALPILHSRGIRYVTLQGGEPLVHPEIVRLVEMTVAAGMSCAVITNGWFLPRYVEALAAAGLSRLIVSIDSARPADHEQNRGLAGLGHRISDGVARARGLGLPVQASVRSAALSITSSCPIRCAGWALTMCRSPIRGANRSPPPHWFTGSRC